MFVTLSAAIGRLNPSVVYGQTAIRSMTDLVDRWISEKRNVISFTATCNCSGLPPAWNVLVESTDVAAAIEVELEYMSLGRHFMTMVRPKGGGVWQFCGPSQRYVISGVSNDAVLVGFEKAVPEWAIGRSDFVLFDPMSIGLGGLRVLDQGVDHLSLLGGIRRTADQKEKWNLKDYGEKVVARSQDGILIVAHRDKGYLPVEFITEYGKGNIEQWNMEYEKLSNCWLVKHAVLKIQNGKETRDFVFDFRWRSINQRLSTGLEAAKRLGKKFNISLVEY